MTEHQTRGPAATQLASRYARNWLITPWESAQIFTSVTERHNDYARTRWRVAARMVVAREASLDAVSKSMTPDIPRNPAELDPWSEDPQTLPETSRQIVKCATCQGEKKITCGNCQGTTRVRCDECSGSGSVPAKRGGLKKCPRCKATGQRKCGNCKSGLVVCSPCDGKGLSQRWFEIKETVEESVYGQDRPPGGHPRYNWPSFDDVAQKPGAQPFEVVVAWRGTSLEAVPELAQTWLDTLKPTLDPRLTRVQDIEIQVVRLRMQEVHFRLAGREGHLAIDPQQQLVLPAESDAKPLGRRLWFIGSLSFLAFILATAISRGYAAQHAFYAKGAVTAMLSVVAWIFIALTTILGALLCLPKETELARRRSSVAMAVGICFLMLFGGTRLGHPTAQHAKTQLEQGHLEQALEELDASIRTDRDREAAQDLFDNYHLEQVKKSTSYKGILAYSGFGFQHPESQQQATQHIAELAEREIGQAYKAHNYKAVETEIETLPDTVKGTSTRLSQMYLDSIKAQGEYCIRVFDKTCITSYSQKLRQANAPTQVRSAYYRQAGSRIDAEAKKLLATGSSFETQDKACHQLGELLTGLDALELAGTAAHPQQYRQTCERWKAQKTTHLKAEADRKARAEAYAKQQAEAAETRRQAAEERQRLRNLNPGGVLMCNDGTASPTCSCPGHRGCCSHHGGIAGCKTY